MGAVQRAVAAVLIAGSVAGVVACTAFGGSDSPGLDASTNEASAGDGGTAAEDGGVADASGCPLLLTEDFGGMPAWDLDLVEGGTVTYDPSDFGANAPSLLGTTLLSGNAYQHAALVRIIPFPSVDLGTVDLKFAMKLEDPVGGSAYAEVGCQLRLRNANAEETYAMFSRSGGGLVATQVGSTFAGGTSEQTSYLINSKVTPGWYDARITARRKGQEAAATFEFTLEDRATHQPHQLIAAAILPNVPDRARVTCGVVYSRIDQDGGTPTTVRAHVDDVTLGRCAP